MNKKCDNCAFYTAVHEVLAGDEDCDGVCGLTGDAVRVCDCCIWHDMDEWFDESA
jgi:hypothetical protein